MGIVFPQKTLAEGEVVENGTSLDQGLTFRTHGRKVQSLPALTWLHTANAKQ